MIAGITRLKSMGLTFDMKGHGTYPLARGTLDRLMEAGWGRPMGRRDAPGTAPARPGS